MAKKEAAIVSRSDNFFLLALLNFTILVTNMNYARILTVLLFLSTMHADSQSFERYFSDSTNWYVGEDFCRAGSNGVAFCGWKSQTPVVTGGSYLVSLDSSFNIIFSRYYEFSFPGHLLRFSRVVQLPDKGFLIGGQIDDSVSSNISPMIARLDSAGNLIYMNELVSQFSNDFSITGLVMLPDSSFIASGINEGSALMKFDSNGYLQKIKYIRGSAGNLTMRFDKMKISSDGNILICAGNSNSQFHDEAVMLKIDTGLNVLWLKEYNRTYSAAIINFAEDQSGDIIICGQTRDTVNGPYEHFIGKLDPFGNQVWMKSYSCNATYFYFNDVLTDGGSYLVSMSATVNFAPAIGLLKTDGAGNILAAETYHHSPDGKQLKKCELRSDNRMLIFYGNAYASVKTGFLLTDSLQHSDCYPPLFTFTDSTHFMTDTSYFYTATPVYYDSLITSSVVVSAFPFVPTDVCSSITSSSADEIYHQPKISIRSLNSELVIDVRSDEKTHLTITNLLGQEILSDYFCRNKVVQVSNTAPFILRLEGESFRYSKLILSRN